jgi:hypothetical protein
MRKLKTLLSAVVLTASGIQAWSQQAAVAAGGDATGAGGSVAFSVGQPVYTTAAGAGGTANQGVQQPYDISTVGVSETAAEWEMAVFPNPTLNELVLQTDQLSFDRLRYSLIDGQGRLVAEDRIMQQNTTIGTSNLAVAVYYLHVFRGEESLKVFKIIKN